MSTESSQRFELRVASLEEGRQRLDVYLTSVLSSLSRSKVQSMIEGGLVTVNGVKETAKFQVREGDVISYGAIPLRPINLEPIAMDLDILFEDEHLLVINKPAGLAVHPGAGEKGPTLVHGLLWHCKKLGMPQTRDDDDDDSAEQNAARPGIVHRLDKDTTGVMVVAKTDEAHAALSKQFHDKTNFRQYVALLNGPFPEGDWVRDSYLHRDPQDRTRFASMDVSKYEHLCQREGGPVGGYRLARTIFKREAQYKGVVSLVSLKLHTGRTHQIRVHARDLGSPILGDQVYGKAPVAIGRQLFNEAVETMLASVHRQMLHAWILGFSHPVTKEWSQFESPLPADFATLVQAFEPYKI